VALGFLLGGHHVGQATSFTFTFLDAPGAFNTFAHGINSRGQIVGFYGANFRGRGFLYKAMLRSVPSKWCCHQG
jgi:hypothetical protein